MECPKCKNQISIYTMLFRSGKNRICKKCGSMVMPGMTPLWVSMIRGIGIVLIIVSAAVTGIRVVHAVILFIWLASFWVIGYVYFRNLWIYGEEEIGIESNKNYKSYIVILALYIAFSSTLFLSGYLFSELGGFQAQLILFFILGIVISSILRNVGIMTSGTNLFVNIIIAITWIFSIPPILAINLDRRVKRTRS